MAKLIRPPIHMIGLTGGPSAGNSLVLDIIENSLGNEVLVVPEASTSLLNQGISPKTHGLDYFQEAVWRLQLQHEWEYAQLALASGRRVLILDRTLIDGAAYITGGLVGHSRDIGTTPEALLRRYPHVVYMESVARRHPHLYVWDANNPRRMEKTAEHAAEVCLRTQAVYRDHPNATFIPSHASAQVKLGHAVGAITRIVFSLAA